MSTKKSVKENCAICGCNLIRGKNIYGTPEGRSHATKHHFVAERFFGRSKNRKGILQSAIFTKCPWSLEKATELFCFDCHEVMLHNPVFTRENIQTLRQIIHKHNLNEDEKEKGYTKVKERIKLLQTVIEEGLKKLSDGL